MRKGQGDVALNKEGARFLKAASGLLKPLSELTKEQIAAVVSLSLAQAVLSLRSSGIKLGDATAAQFTRELRTASPSLSRIVARYDFLIVRPGGPCWNQFVAWAQAQDQCEKENKKPVDQRNPYVCMVADGKAADLATCQFKLFKATVKGPLRQIWGRLKPPRPFPWPV